MKYLFGFIGLMAGLSLQAQDLEVRPGGISAFAAAFRTGDWTAMDFHQVLSLEAFSGRVRGKTQFRLDWAVPQAEAPLIDVEEAWVAWTGAALQLTLGRQVVRWGVLEALGLWDDFSPPEGLPFLTGRWEVPRKDRTAFRLQYRPGEWGTEFLLLPLGEDAVAPRPENGGGGLRLQWFGPGLDLTLEGSTLPPGKAPRVWTWGGEAAAVWESWLIKAEGAYSTEKPFPFADGTTRSIREMKGAAGLEWSGGGWRVLSELRGTFLEEDTGILSLPSGRWEAAGRIFWQPDADVWDLSLDGWADITLQNWCLHPSLIWRLTQGLELKTGLEWAEGTQGVLALTGRGTGFYSHLVWIW